MQPKDTIVLFEKVDIYVIANVMSTSSPSRYFASWLSSAGNQKKKKKKNTKKKNNNKKKQKKQQKPPSINASTH